MFKYFIYILISLLALTACDINENKTIEKQKINFSINELSRQLSKKTTLTNDLSKAKKAVITLSVDNVAKYEEVELTLINWGDDETFRTDILEVEANINYDLTQFELRDENDKTIFATPFEGAPFANLVNAPLPIPVKVESNKQSAVSIEVLSTENSTPADFGYPYFDVKLKSKEAFSITVKSNGNLLESKLELTSGDYYLEKALSLGKNIVTFDSTYDNYQIKITSAGYKSITDNYTRKELIGSDLIVELVKQTMTQSDSPEWSDYEIIYTDEFPNENNTGLKGVNLTKSELTPSRSLHIYNDGRIITNGANLDPESEVGKKIHIDLIKSEIIIENLNVYDGIYIYNNCNIKNIIIRKCYIYDGSYGISCKNNDGTFITIEDCTIETPGGSRRKAILANNCIIRRCNISNYIDGIYFVNNVIVESNYIHDLYTFPGSHDDGVQGCGKNVIIVNNNINAINHNACIMTSTQTGSLHNMWVEHNYLAGGAYIIYAVDKENKNDPSYTLKNITIKNNILQSESYLYGYMAYTNEGEVFVSGNTDENGNLLNVNND